VTVLKQVFCYLTGQVYVDEMLLMHQGKRLLHISDTPRSFYPALARLIEKLKPEYIVHSGDLVDNIKLQMYPNSLMYYKKDVQILLSLLESSSAEKIFIAIGNHDNAPFIHQNAARIHIIDLYEQVTIEGISIAISHYPKPILSDPAEINLFGHDLTLKTHSIQNQVFLNGISNIHLIELDSKIVHSLNYPSGTDDQRLGKSRIRF
jgi:predicted phosphodiesterase